MTLTQVDGSHVASVNRQTSWVALCYHDVQPVMPSGGGGPDHFTVPIASFELMLDTIARAGYHGCSVAAALAEKEQRRVAITFDDGTRGQYDYAFPALTARGMTATFYVTTEWVGTPGFMTWDELRRMVASGMSVQSHTKSHPFLSELDADALREELGMSKRVLDAELNQRTTEIAFPGGDAPLSELRYLIRESGYDVAVGTRWGVNHDSAATGFLKRCTVRGPLTADMAQRVVSADRWLTAKWIAKETTLRNIRSTLGASRYARWRRIFLDAVVKRNA